jgi:hypothetical protein
MRALLLPVMFGMLSSAALAQDAGLPLNPPPRLTIEKTAAGDLPSGPDAPVLESITWRALVRTPNGMIMDLVPDFHFQAPKGNAVMLRRELVDTNGNIAQTQIASATINTPAEAQKKGAVISGGWMCGTAQYYVTLRAYVMDADGKRSNALRYTLHCNGG